MFLRLRRTLRLGLFAVTLSAASVASAAAQESTLTPGSGGGFQMMVDWPNCGWTLSKPWPMWGWVRARFTGDREYANETAEGGTPETVLSITIKGDYLPSQNIECTAYDYGVETGPVIAPQGTSYTWNHVNPACDGHPPLNFGYHPGVRTILDERMNDPRNAYILQGFLEGQYYWGNVGQELNYTDLNSMNGTSDTFVTTTPNLPPNVPGDFTVSTRWIRFNENLWQYTANYWRNWAAHELGHAHGFDHATGGTDEQTVLRAAYGFTPFLNVTTGRVLDKCAAVKAYPVPLR
jgi:hypothetical protein